jgi:histidinol-phosphate aminotransferase
VSYWYLLGAKPVQSRTYPEESWKIDADDLRKKITERTKWITIVNPNNPTGTIVTKAEVDEFFKNVPEDVLVVMDDAYLEYIDDPEYPDSFSHFGRAGTSGPRGGDGGGGSYR